MERGRRGQDEGEVEGVQRKLADLIVADTDVIIDFFTGTRPTSDMVSDIIREKRLGLTSITVYELYAGVSGRQRLKQIENLVTSLPIFSFGATEAAVAGEIYTGLKAQGRLIGHQDIIISGICITHRLPLFTNNMPNY